MDKVSKMYELFDALDDDGVSTQETGVSVSSRRALGVRVRSIENMLGNVSGRDVVTIVCGENPNLTLNPILNHNFLVSALQHKCHTPHAACVD